MISRYDFVYLFDVKDGNPNGDPDAGNLPRVDPETGHGLVTDVCLKRKIRNYVGLVKEEKPPYEIYVKEKAVLNNQHARAYESLKLDPKKRKSKGKDKAEEDKQLTSWMCSNFFDIRSFGAVMTTDTNCGQVRGPIQLAMARSIDPVVSLEHALTRCAVTTEREAEKQEGGNRTMGRKFTIPYGLYRVHGFVNPHLAAQTGFNSNGGDLELLWNALLKMFETDRSASRGEMSPQKLVLFEHESPLGNAPAHQLFERVQVGSASSNDAPPRSFSDYEFTIDKNDLPDGITIHELL
jgi:CRISPR-associated protein Csd2